jgi:hypothetical protein
MAAKLTRLTHKIVVQLYLLAESCIICSSSSRRPVRKLLDTPSDVSVFLLYNPVAIRHGPITRPSKWLRGKFHCLAPFRDCEASSSPYIILIVLWGRAKGMITHFSAFIARNLEWWSIFYVGCCSKIQDSKNGKVYSLEYTFSTRVYP